MATAQWMMSGEGISMPKFLAFISHSLTSDFLPLPLDKKAGRIA
jgi:hypothetical protein